MKTFFHILALCLFGFLATNGDSFCQDSQTAVLFLEHEKPNAWNQMLEQGFYKGCKQFNFACKVETALPGADQSTKFGEEAQKAWLVIVASDTLHETLRNNAAKFRRVKFGSIDAGIRAANIMSATFADEEAGFLAGYAAAMLADSLKPQKPVLGWLSGENTPAMQSLYNGFVEGARLCKPSLAIFQALAGSFDDIETAKLKALSLKEQGAQLIVLAAGAGNKIAAESLLKDNVWIILLDDNFKLPNVLGSINRRADKAIFDIMSSASEKFRAKEIDIHNLADSYVNFKLAPNLLKTDKKLFENINRRVEELRKEFIAGAIRVPSLRARTLCDCLD